MVEREESDKASASVADVLEDFVAHDSGNKKKCWVKRHVAEGNEMIKKSNALPRVGSRAWALSKIDKTATERLRRLRDWMIL